MKLNPNISGMALGLAVASMAAGGAVFAAQNTSNSSDPAVEHARQEVKMLDDLFKNVIALIDGHYVKAPSDFSAAASAKALFGVMKKDGWFSVRLLGLTDVIGDADDVPRDPFEKTAAQKLLAGAQSYEEIVDEGGKRYLRVATGVPVVEENCVMCHENFKGQKGFIGALSYTVPVNK